MGKRKEGEGSGWGAPLRRGILGWEKQNDGEAKVLERTEQKWECSQPRRVEKAKL